jgi:amino acid adenylation domain-containing protein/thioester reductase-like protein
MTEMSNRLAGLSAEEKRALLARALEKREGAHESNLSVAQERQWFLHQLDAETPSLITTALSLEGPLDTSALQQSLVELTRRQESLRMSFSDVGGRPLRLVAGDPRLALPVVDVTDRPEAERREELVRVAKRDAEERFALDKAPLLRVTLVRLGAEEHVLLATFHRIVADEQSAAAFACELADLYAAFAEGQVPSLPELRQQYADVAAAERRWLATPELDDRLAHWRERLAGIPALELPTDRPRPAVQTPFGATAHLTVGTAAEPDAVLAAFALVLGRSAGQRDVVIGVPSANRGRPELERLIGPLANTLVLRIDLDGDPTFAELVERVARVRAEAEANGRVPFERLVQELQPARDLSRTPLFQAFADVRPEPPEALEAAGVRIVPEPLDFGLAQFDVALTATPAPEGMDAALTYKTDLFEAGTMERLLQHVQLALAAGTSSPDVPVGDLSLLGDEERETIAAFEQGPSLDPPEACLHELVEAQAERTPDAIAVEAGEQQLTYRELDERANRLAHELRSLEVGRDSLVGVFLDRSPAMLVALLGVMKAGGAYLPIDPAYPAERVRFMLEDAGVAVVLCEERGLERLPEHGATVLCLDRDRERIDAQPGERPDPVARPDDLAYVIYTSGSTGSPKGVLVPHRQAVASTAARWSFYDDDPASFLLLSPISFDSSVAGVYWTLSRGGTLVLASAEELDDPGRLAKRVAVAGVTHLLCVPSLYSVLLSSGVSSLRGLRVAAVAGEACPPELVARHRSQLPETLLVNEYGPTETTVWATAYVVDGDVDGTVPIGPPIPGARVRLLDERLGRVPIGVRGELYVGGAGVTRGYLGRSGLTAERFVPDPYADEPGSRLYATGDVARYRADGSLEFIGRVDEQVKIRGYRIELGEIEAALAQHQDVSEVAVAAPQGVQGERRLVAYLVAPEGVRPSRSELVSFLQTRLPDYMVPATFLLLDDLPRTPSGKVDRNALPAPDEDPAELRTEYVAPRTPLEATIARVFGEVLGREKIGVNDSFFDLGGHSLLLAELASGLRNALDVDMPLRYFFEVPTTAGLGRLVEVYQREGLDAALAAAGEGDLAADAVLDPEITPDGLPLADLENPKAAFVTGATGYIGAYIVAELLRRTPMDVYCLVRAENAEEGKNRLRSTFETFRIVWPDEYDDRVVPVVGDLEKPLLGLDDSQFEELARTVDAIYHSGARVNFVYPYPALKPANVGGATEVLRLACRAKAKPLHHVSTADVFLGTGVPRPWMEQDVPDDPANLPDGYIRSKWVAEKLVSIARDRGLPVTIHRPALTMGHTETGASHTTDFLAIALKGYLQLGLVPDYDEAIVAVPIDYVSAGIVHLSLQPENAGKIFHYANPSPAHLREVYSWLRSFGYEIEVVPYTTLREHVLEVDPSHALYPVLPLYPPEERLRRELFEVTAFEQIDCRTTNKGLEGTGIECAAVAEELVHTVLAFFVETGWLDPPQKQRAGVGAGAEA